MSVNGLEFMPSATDLVRFSPELILTVMGTFLMVLDGMAPKARSVFGHISLFTMVAAIAAAVYANGFPGTSYSDILMVDGFATFFRVLVLIVGILAVLASYRFLARAEFHLLLDVGLGEGNLPVSGEYLEPTLQ